ncbi:MAG TPA: acylphosphatase [Burkholderiaceae bacterium]|nr:acylphosphatase [Burkholderiaceae bacterium]
MAARRFVIRGIVQGVGFRHATRSEAQRFGLRGWVRNCADGSVEAVALGDDARLDAFERWARRGPPGARVDSVEVTLLADDALARLHPPVGDGFRQVETAWT